jgi:hypothetical protein
MGNRGLVPANNQRHNVPALLEEGCGSLRALARAHFLPEGAGQAPATIDAKRRDLTRFFEFYAKLYGHDRPEEWYASVTREFLKLRASNRRANPSPNGRDYRAPTSSGC